MSSASAALRSWFTGDPSDDTGERWTGSGRLNQCDAGQYLSPCHQLQPVAHNVTTYR